MESNEQNSPQQLPPKRSIVVEALTGGTIGATIGLITSVFHKKMGRGKQAAIGAAVGAGIGVTANLLSSKETAAPAVNETIPPSLPHNDQGVELETTPRILDILVARHQLTPEQKAHVLTEIKNGRSGFSAEIAVADGFVTKVQVDEALKDQALSKIDNALHNISAINSSGRFPESSLYANWGNNGVNPAAQNPTQSDGIAAAATIAENLVALANNTSYSPQMRQEALGGVVAAANIARGIAHGNSAQVPLQKMGDTWRETIKSALQHAVTENHFPEKAPKDAHGKPIDINTYIAARDTEIAAAVQQTLAAGTDRSQNQGRA